MSPYPVMCYGIACDHKKEAIYKIASEWSDGVTRELKTYSLCCRGCLQEELKIAREKKSICRLAAGESLGDPVVFERYREGREWKLKPIEIEG